MALSTLPVRISFEETMIAVSRLRVHGRTVFSVSFSDGRPSEMVTRMKDAAGYYWVSLLREDSRMAALIGKRIIEYIAGLPSRSR